MAKWWKKERAWFIAFGILFAIFGTCGGCRAILRARVNKELAAIRAMGYPATPEELIAAYSAPLPGENAAPLYAQAFLCMVADPTEKLPFVGGAYPPPGEPLPEDIREAIAKHLAANRPALQLLHDAAAIEQCRHAIRFARPLFNTLLPPLVDTRAAARLLALETIATAEAQDSKGTVDCTMACLSVGRSLEGDPFLISQLVGIACESICAKAMQNALSRCQLADEQCRTLNQDLARHEDSNGLVRGTAGEACFGVDVFDMPAATMGGFPGLPFRSAWLDKTAWTLYRLVGLSDADKRAYLWHARRGIEICQMPEAKRRGAAAELDADLQKLPPAYMLSRLVGCSMEGVVSADLINKAYLRAARTALAVERYRLAHDRLPGTLDELVPQFLDAMPKDPFDGKPLRYKLLEKGYMVYSIGPDGKDDGGKEKVEGKQDALADITFTVAR